MGSRSDEDLCGASAKECALVEDERGEGEPLTDEELFVGSRDLELHAGLAIGVQDGEEAREDGGAD